MAEFPNNSQYPETEAQAYVARLSTRPALAALVGLLASFPVLKIFASNGVPLMLAREKSRLAAAPPPASRDSRSSVLM